MLNYISKPMGRWDITGKNIMKKLFFVFFMLLVAGAVFACNVPDGYSYRQDVVVVDSGGGKCQVAGAVYHAVNSCDAFGICFQIGYGSSKSWYYVSKSDKDGYKYMFWYYDRAMYFNM